MSETFKYDVFISHSAKDKAGVRELAERLRADGLRVWFDEWEIQPGDLILHKIEQGLEQSQTLILVMSANAFASEWVTLERSTVMFRDPTNEQRRFIPVRLDDSEIKQALKQFAHIDWRERSDEQYAKLLAICKPTSIAPQPETEQKSKQSLGRVLRGHTDWVRWVSMTPDGKRAISGSIDKTIRVWGLEPGKCVAKLKAYPVMLVIRNSEGQIRWMDVSKHLREHGAKARQISFEGEPFTALSVVRLRDTLLRPQ